MCTADGRPHRARQVHRARGCLCLAVSRDAVRWSAPRPLLRCDAAGERTVDHPAIGVVVRGGRALLYVHEGVPGIREDARLPEAQRVRLAQLLARPRAPRRAGRGAGGGGGGGAAGRLGPPRIVRYAIPMRRLRKWTREGLRELRGVEGAALTAVSLNGPSSLQ